MKIEYIECTNCLTGYGSNEAFCPVCFVSRLEGENQTTFFDNYTRSELSKNGGAIAPIIRSEESHIVVPCEWGVVCTTENGKFLWSSFLGLVSSVIVEDRNVHVLIGSKKHCLAIESGQEHV